MSVQRRCQSCHVFYDKKLGACSACGAEPYAFNKFLRTAGLNNQLYSQAGSATKEKQLERAFASRRVSG